MKSLVILLMSTFGTVSYAALSSSMSSNAAFAELSKYSQCDSFTKGKVDYMPSSSKSCGCSGCSFPECLCMEDISTMFADQPTVVCKKLPSACYSAASSGGGSSGSGSSGSGGGSSNTEAPRPNPQVTTRRPTPVTVTAPNCKSREVVSPRENNCERNCDDKDRSPCFGSNPGCVCRPGYIRKTASSNSICVPLRNCPADTGSGSGSASGGQDAACKEARSMGERCVENGRAVNRWATRYYWTGSECRNMLYRGCGGTKNNFEDKEACEDACADSDNGGSSSGGSGGSAACTQPRQQGKHCGQRWQTRYYYNAANKSCGRFWYTGCEGNDNNFESRSACESACGN